MQSTSVWVWGQIHSRTGKCSGTLLSIDLEEEKGPSECKSFVSQSVDLSPLQRDHKLIEECRVVGGKVWMASSLGKVYQWNRLDLCTSCVERLQGSTVTSEFDGDLGDDRCIRYGIESIAQFQDKTLVTNSKGELLSFSSVDEHSFDLIPVPLLPKVSIKHIRCGSNFAIAIDFASQLLSWGECVHGELGHGKLRDTVDTPRYIDSVQSMRTVLLDCGWDHAMVYTSEDQLFAWGCGRDGKLGTGREEDIAIPIQGVVSKVWTSSITSLSCGYGHNLIIDESGKVFGWGSNSKGQLGLGDTKDRHIPHPINAFDTVPVLSISCGAFHSAAITAIAELYTWGWGECGQLGHGDLGSVSCPKLVEHLVGKDVVSVSCGGQFTVAVTKHFESPQRTSGVSVSDGEWDLVSPIGSCHSNSSDFGIHQVLTQSSWSFSKSLMNPFTPSVADFGDNAINGFRPKNLPPKDPKETRKHLKEVLAKRKLYSELLLAVQSSKEGPTQPHTYSTQLHLQKERLAMQLQNQRESRLRRDELFWLDCTGNWQKYRNSKKVHEKCLKFGIPSMSREIVWKTAIGNPLSITKDLFIACGTSVEKAQCDLSKQSSLFPENSPHNLYLNSLQSLKLISVDLERTFPSLAFFQSESQMYEDLRMVLERFCFWRPDLGYVQGMSYLAGNLLLYLDPFDSFVCLCNLLNSRMLYDFMRLKQANMSQWHELFDAMLQESFPRLREDLYFTLDREMFEHMCLTEWFITLYCRPLALDVAGRVWDCYVVMGDLFLFQTAIGILLVLWPKLKNQSLETVCKVLRNDPFSMPADVLFEHIPLKSKISKSCRKRLLMLSQADSL